MPVSNAFHELIEPQIGEIRRLARAYGVARLEVFGSVMTSAFDPARSDIDMLVEYPPDYDHGPWLSRFQDLEEDLSAMLGRGVHLVMTSALRQPLFAAEVAATRTVIHDARTVTRAA